MLSEVLKEYSKTKKGQEHRGLWVKLASISEFDMDALKEVVKEVIVHDKDKIEVIWNVDDIFKKNE